MNKLDLCPLQSSYSVKYGTSVERIELRGGFGRYVQTKNAKKHLVDVGFTLRENDFIYFRAFFLNWQLNPLPFLMSLIIEDSEFREYIAQFVPDSFAFSELNGTIFSVSAQVVVVTTEVQIQTSKPYPLYFEESIATDFIVKHSVLAEAVQLTENIGTSLVVENAQYISEIIYISYSTEHESVQSSFSVRNAQYVSEASYKSISDEVFVSTAFSVKNAEIRDIRIEHNAGNESVKTSFSVGNAQYIQEN